MERLVHVVPLGWEVDRAVLPVKAMKAHRVYLLANPDSHPWSRHFLDRVRSQLEEAHIEVRQVIVDADVDLKGLVREIGRIVKKEVAAGNRIYINASAAGKIAAIAATLAGMAHLNGRGVVYYARPQGYILSEEEQMRHGLTKGLEGDPVPIPLFRIALPSSVGGLILYRMADIPEPRTVTYQEIFEWLHAADPHGFPRIARQTSRRVKTGATVKLSKTILSPLREAGYITIHHEGRRAVVELTDAGTYMAHLIAEP